LEYKSLLGSKGSKANEETIRDLRIEELINDILGNDKNQFLIDVFKEPLSDKNAIDFRLKIFNDLMDEKIYNVIKNFVNKIKDCNRLMDLEAKTYEEFKYGFHIDVALIYVNTVENTLNLMRELNIKSDGILYFINYLENLIQSDRFQALKRITYEAKTAREKIKVRININGDRIRVSKEENGEDLTSKIEQLFSRFKGQQVHELKFDRYYEQITHIHAGILNGVYRIFKEEFNIMKKLKDEFPDIVDEGIKSFANEFEFYLKYIEYMKSIQSNGYKFSIPQFTEDGSIHVKGFYNLLLARKKVAVANDIHTTGNKRVFIITGINSGGKTTFAITFGQLAFLSLIGVPVPAEEAKIRLFSNIMTAFPIEEDKTEDLSRLEKDVERVYNILKTADDKTLIIVNELFSSTTSEEGFELAKRFIEKITSKGSYLIYVTFITKIATLENVISLVTQIQDEKPTFKIIESNPLPKYMAIQIASKHRLLYEDIKKVILNDSV